MKDEVLKHEEREEIVSEYGFKYDLNECAYWHPVFKKRITNEAILYMDKGTLRHFVKQVIYNKVSGE